MKISGNNETSLVRHKEEGKVDSARYILAMKATKLAYQAGVKINAGSDHMIDIKAYNTVLNIHRELKLFAEAGLSNIDVLRTATIVNAVVLGQEDNIGSVEEGKNANLVILYTNPLSDIKSTTDIKYVFKRGKIVN